MTAVDLWIDFRREEDVKNFIAFAIHRYPKLQTKQIKVSPEDARGRSGTVVIYDVAPGDVDEKFFFELAVLGVELSTVPEEEEE